VVGTARAGTNSDYGIQLGATNIPAMNIFVPFTKVEQWTMAAMLWYLHHTTFVDVSGDHWNYVKFFEQRWAEGKTFINVEHDVVPGPGVLDSMWACQEPWCVSTYLGPPAPKGAPFFGVVKFSAEAIATLPDLWVDYRRGYQGVDRMYPWRADAAWMCLDTYFYEYVAPLNVFGVHYHWPCATHGGKGDAFYAPVKVTDSDGTLIRDHELSSKTIELSLRTL
jgi:hypothetical protein